MRVELVQIAGCDGDTVHNLERAPAAIADCAADAELVMLPEAHLTGLPSEDNIAALAEPPDGPTVSAVQHVARERNVSVAISIVEADAGRYYNTTLLIVPDGVALKYRKTHLWVSDRGIFTPDDRYATALRDGIRVGLLVCFDIEFPGSVRVLGQSGTKLTIVTSGNMDSYGPIHRITIVTHAMENQAYAVVVNHVGHGDGRLVFADDNAVVDPYGQLLHEVGREERRQIVELDLGRLQDACRDYRYLKECRLILPSERRGHPDGSRELLIP